MQKIKIDKKLLNKLEQLGFTKLTLTQEKFLPKTLNKNNFVGIAPTGTGKTLSYIIPIIQKMILNNKIQAGIILPTNQLAEQVYEEFSKFKSIDDELKITLLRRNKVSLGTKNILVGTIDSFKENYKSNKYDYIILDELDMLIDDGFDEDVLGYLIQQKIEQFQAYSATHDPNIIQKLKLISPQIDVSNLLKDFKIPPLIDNYLINANNESKIITELVKVTNPYLMLIFASKIDKVVSVFNQLNEELGTEYSVALIHGGMNQSMRKNILQGIKNHQYRIIVCSDMLARGIDIEQVSHVVNYDLPNNLDYFFHRVGRTGRNNHSGQAYTIATDENSMQIKKIIERKVEFVKVKIKNGQIDLTNSQKREKVKENIQSKYLLEGQKKALSKIKSKQIGKPGYRKKIKKIATKEASKLKKQYFRQGNKK
jgi:ATP-dependent RNA helicase CshB